jgi:hypothetical protein
MLLLVLNLLGLLGLTGGVFAFIRNRRQAHRIPQPALRITLLAIGAALGAASTSFAYPLDDNTQIIGLPFTAAAFEGGADFVGPLTIPAFLANFAFWFLLPQLVLLLVRQATARPP